MSETAKFKLPLIAANQAQKHVTHNEALAELDDLMGLHVLGRMLTTPPAASDGDCYLVPVGAAAEWLGQDGRIASRRDGVWRFYEPVDGQTAYVANEGTLIIRSNGAWWDYGGLLAPVATLSRGAFGGLSQIATLEAELSGLSGAYVETSPIIPDRAIVFGVSTRTSAEITGASSYGCGLTGEPDKFGGLLGTSAGSQNAGVIGPQAFYAATPVRLTANGGAFTGGSVRLAVHCFLPGVPE